MIELKKNRLIFTFPEVHADAKLEIEFQRTLRIPDDDRRYPLPPGLGRFSMEHVDDHAESVPPAWLRHGGVMLPMYQSEALWINFHQAPNYNRRGAPRYPFAVKIAAGKINAVTGDDWDPELHGKGGDFWDHDLNVPPQDFLAVPQQPWLDGYVVEKGTIRQFVAMPLGAGYSAEEQITGKGEFGGLQVLVYPMKAEEYERRFPREEMRRRHVSRMFAEQEDVLCCMDAAPAAAAAAPDMALAPGGKMKQEIYDSEFPLSAYDDSVSTRCFVHLANSLVWHAITGNKPPHPPPTSAEYTRHGLPWFDYYADNQRAVDAQEKLKQLKSVIEMAKEKGDQPLPENKPANPQNIVRLRRGLRPGEVRDGMF